MKCLWCQEGDSQNQTITVKQIDFGVSEFCGELCHYRQAHHSVLSQYAEHELNTALRDTCSALVRAMKLNILVLNNPLANITGHQGYIEPEQTVMQQVKAWLELAVKGCNIRLTDEPVLFKTGLSASTLPHMEHDVAATPGQRKVWQEKMREREADLKARGLLS